MFKKITTNNVQIQSAMSTIAMDDESSIDLTTACNKMSEQVSIIFSKIGKGKNSYRNISLAGHGYGRRSHVCNGRNYVGRYRGCGRGRCRQTQG